MKKGRPIRVGDGRDFIPEDIIRRLDRNKDGLVWCARCQRVWHVDDLLYVGGQVVCADLACDGRLSNLRGYAEHRWRMKIRKWPAHPVVGSVYRAPARKPDPEEAALRGPHSGRPFIEGAPAGPPAAARRPVRLGADFERALVYASLIHTKQRRKGTTIPYISHLLGVASIVLEAGGGESAAIAALLHDAVEDQGGRTRLEDIAAKFGPRVAEIVMACSDTDKKPKPSWRERKEAYLRHLRATSDADVLLVSAADKLHNARALLRDYEEMGDWVWARFNADKISQLWYYGQIVQVLRSNRRAPRAIVGELVRVVSRLRRLAGSER